MRGRAVGSSALVIASFVYFASTFNNWVGSGGPSHIVVKTNQGSVRGVRLISRTGRNYYEFKGIPYAEPPLGILRFEPPLKARTWEGVRDATAYGSTCLQYEYLTKILQGSEDCLFLNVATHKVLTRKESRQVNLAPVIVFIHGGAFMSGFSNVYRAKYMMDENIVLVTLNYRLASFGFLNTGDGVVRGNMGLKDQVMALKWVQENIRYFGGDNKKVTIVGESAGGASVHLHMLSPMSKGLFHRAIAQSGSGLNSFALTPNPRKQATRLARKVGCPTANSNQMVYCLKSKQALELNAAHYEYLDFLSPREAYYAPSVEIPTGKDDFLVDHPKNLLLNGSVHDVPLIMGVNSDEGLLFIVDALLNKTRFNALNYDWETLAPRVFHYEAHPNKSAISAKIRKYYFGNNSFNMNTMKPAVNLFSDRYFFEGAHDTGMIQGRLTPVYLYYFTYQGQFGFANFMFGMTKLLPEPIDALWSATQNWFSVNILRMQKRNFGVCHSDDLPVFFNLPVVAREIVPGTEDYAFSSEAVRLWVSFARNGVPDKFLGVEWPAVNISHHENNTLEYLKFDDRPEIIPEPYSDRIEFWKSLNLE